MKLAATNELSLFSTLHLYRYMRCLCTYHESLVPLPGLVWLLLLFSAEEFEEKFPEEQVAEWELWTLCWNTMKIRYVQEIHYKL